MDQSNKQGFWDRIEYETINDRICERLRKRKNKRMKMGFRNITIISVYTLTEERVDKESNILATANRQ